jgi:hypothetical protein
MGEILIDVAKREDYPIFASQRLDRTPPIGEITYTFPERRLGAQW